jgi:hypothetical protein
MGALAAGSASRLRAGQSNTFKLGIITDELTGQLEDALPFFTRHHLEWCELREMWGKNIMNLSKEELDRARKLIATSVRTKSGSSVTGVWTSRRGPTNSCASDWERQPN